MSGGDEKDGHEKSEPPVAVSMDGTNLTADRDKDKDKEGESDEDKDVAIDKSQSPTTATSKSSSPTLSTSAAAEAEAEAEALPRMCLEPCHRFHTNPALSSPQIQSNTSNANADLDGGIGSASGSNGGKSKISSSASSGHIQPGGTSKAIKRKQRLAQYKAQTQVSTSDNRNSSGSGGSIKRNGSGTGGLIGGEACHAVWAPNLNYTKNVELLAIASPLSLHDKSGSGNNNTSNSSGGMGVGNNLHLNHGFSLGNNANQQQTDNSGSQVYVLVFDEGTFAHCSEFSLASELCDLFGLPTQIMSTRNTRKKTQRCGMRRTVFHNPHLNENKSLNIQSQSSDDDKNNKQRIRQQDKDKDKENEKNKEKENDNNISKSNSQDKEEPSGVASQVHEKAQNLYSKLSTKYVMPFVSHVASEIENCNNLFRYEVFDDGRIFGLPEASRSKQRDNGNGSASPTPNLEQQKLQNQNIQVQEIAQSNSHENGSDKTLPYPIRPQLVFHLNLPYSNTSMEVIGLEWNADGTNLSILQRKKSSSAGSSNAYNYLSSSTVTNKKKKANNYNYLPAIAPGNTAVSFWSIPEWLHVTAPAGCEDLKLCSGDNGHDLEDDLKFDGDGIIVKANNTVEGTVGWEVERTDENTSLFPLWEWYLSRYIFNDEIIPTEHSHGTNGHGSAGLGLLDLDGKGSNGSGSNVVQARRTKIMLKNCMEYSAYPMELVTTGGGTSTSSSSTRPKKSASRATRASTNSGENANAMMNGDVTCLIWEDTSLYESEAPSDEEKEGQDTRSTDSKGAGQMEEEDTTKTEKDDKESSSTIKKKDSQSSSSSVKPAKGPASKWVAVGTSKGQMLLHNVSASHVSQQSRKASKKSGSDNSKAIGNVANIPAQGRTVAIPLRHKKRITCGTWVDNLLVFGHVSTGFITIVSTFPKSTVEDANSGEKDVRNSNSCKTSLFEEKTIKVLGTIPLPGGRDAVNIHMGFVEDDLGKLTILSVNCEGKGLLFYSFPKSIDASNINALASNITSSAAVEVNFSMTSSNSLTERLPQIKGASCGNILFHYLIPNTLLVFIVFSSGYFALVDWVGGVILSDVDVAIQAHRSLRGSDPPIDHTIEHHDNFILDVTYHVVTSTIACLTESGVILVYHLRILDGCNDLKAGDCRCTTGIAISTKTHTRPKAKGSSTSSKHDNLVDCDPSVKRMMGTVDFLCSRTIKNIPSIQPDARRGNLINFSADGEALSISWGDESVEILGINMDDAESDHLKQRVADSMYLGKDHVFSTFLFMICILIVWSWGKLSK